MKHLIPIVVVLTMGGCFSKNRLPDPYAGFEHTAAEQGYWREVTSDKEPIGEMHIHTKGFSITYSPFETYKDYWGTYTMNEKQDEIHLTVDSGNHLPEFQKAIGTFQRIGGNSISISGIGLDSRKPKKKHFCFERIHPK